MGILRGGVDAHMLSLSSFSRGHLIEAFTSRSVFYGNLVGGSDHVYFSIQLGMSLIIPIDFHIFQRGRYTTNQIFIDYP